MSARASRIRPARKGLLPKPADEFESCWDLLRDALTDIHTKNAGRLSFEGLYRASYKIVLKKKGEELYERVKAFEENWFHTHIMPPILDLISQNLVSMALAQHPGTSAYERRQMSERFLRGVRDSWADHNTSMNMIADILMYLDRAWSGEAKKPSVFASTIGLFRDNILRSPLNTALMEADDTFIVFDVLTAVILDLINMERDGDIIDKNLVLKIVSMLEDLYETDEEQQNQKLYLTVFEPRYLGNSREFYRKECQRLLEESDAGTWLRHTQRRLVEEEERCETTVSMLTADKIAQVVEEEMISPHMEEFLGMEGSGLKTMIDNDRLEDLTVLYYLISRVDRTKAALKKVVQSRVLELGLEIEAVLKTTDFSGPGAADGDEAAAEEAEKAKAQPLNAAAQQTAAAIKWVDDVLRLKDKFDNIWRNCFAEDVVLQSAITRSFSEFINMFNRSSEYVSLFIDDSLKRGIKGKTEAEVDAVLDKAIILLRYLSDRDMFERYYQKHLARRLLHGRSESQDVEKEMISRMKQEMGNHFTTKFEGMFKDMELSRDLATNYRDHIRNLGDVDTRQIELGINVLTTNNWPPEVMGRGSVAEDSLRGECVYPPEIKRLQDSFTKFYLKDRSGRILTWVSTAGSADIKCVFPKIPGKETGPLSKERRYELSVSTYGMIVLALFNHLAAEESLTLDEIQEQTRIPVSDLMKTLASLSLAPKSRVLVKNPSSKLIRPGDRFSYNAQFVSKAIKIKAPTVSSLSKVEADEERKETVKKNDQTRAHIVDAAIVRIMKQRKQLRHTQLTTEVLTQLSTRFKPEISLIKKRIEDLLSREYLERVEGDMSTYRYLA